jgi:AraC-like DNA-binding protein
MDALSDVLRIVDLSGGIFFDAELTDPWWVAGQASAEACRPFMVPPAQIVAFHYVVEGVFELRLKDEPACRVSAGEAVLMPHNDPHVFGTPGATMAPVGVDQLIQPGNAHGVAKVVHGGGGARTRLVCGFMGGNAQLQPLLESLPAVMTIKVADLPGGDWIGHTFAYAAQTLSEGDPGAATVLAKLSELLFVESVRRYLAGLPEAQTGWLAGLRDPAVGRALSLLHSRVAEAWTAEALAQEVNMSRSAFADRFTAITGQPPMRYLTGWRMQLARNYLAETRRTVAQIAYEVGYESEAAFSRAFHRECGHPPAAWRRQAAT